LEYKTQDLVFKTKYLFLILSIIIIIIIIIIIYYYYYYRALHHLENWMASICIM